MTAKVSDIRSRKGSGGGGTATGFYRGKYAPETFIVPGQDTNGNSMRLWCRVVPLLDRAIDVLFATRKFPFKSKGDLVRWCIKSGVERLNEMEPCVGSVLAQAEAMMSVLRDEELNHSFMTVFHTMTSTVGMHIQAQAIGEARRVVSTMKGQIMKMEPGYWRERYLSELETKFGHLLKGSMVAGAGLGEHTDSGPDASGVDEEDQE